MEELFIDDTGRRREAGDIGWSHRAVQIAVAGIVLAYFIRFVGPGLHGIFNNDDPGNIYYYWKRGPNELARNLVLFFTTYSRPMGGVYFSALYHFFGLDPLPYHVVTTILLFVNTCLAFRFGALLSGSRLIGALTALLVTYHHQMAHLVYLPAYVFDVICFTFYFLALDYYLAIRSRGAALTKTQVVVFLLLYIGALDAKEMAVTLPVIVLLYEFIWRWPGRSSFGDMVGWVRRHALPSLLAGVVTLVYILGKTFGADTLVRMEAYRPVFTWSRYCESTSRFVNTILHQPWDTGFFQPSRALLLAAILLYIAWRSKKKHLLWMWLFLWITPLPITFLPGRGGALLYIPLAGWAVFGATLFVSLCEAMGTSRVLRIIPPRVTHGVLVLTGIGLLWACNADQSRDDRLWLTGGGAGLTWSMIQEVRTVQPTVKPGARIYVVNDPWGSWDAKMIMELVYHDRTVNVELGSHSKLTPGEIDRMDYIFTFENGRLLRLKGP